MLLQLTDPDVGAARWRVSTVHSTIRHLSEVKPLILILGPGKSGTTALFFCLKKSAAHHFGVEFPDRFEPKTAADFDAFAADFGIAKMLLERFDRTTHEFLPRFDKRIFICRDPRDNVISRLVYYTGTRLKFADGATRETIMQKFSAKQRNPDSISVVELFDVIAPLIGKTGAAEGARKRAFSALGFRPPDNLPFFRLRYEDFVDGSLTEFQDYLGFEIRRDFQVPRRLQRVRRTETHGYWKSWFTEADHAYFVAERAEEMVRLGYTDLAPYRGSKVISSKEISEYLERQLTQSEGSTPESRNQ